MNSLIQCISIELPCVNVLSKMDLLQTTSNFGSGSRTNKGEQSNENNNDDNSDYGYDEDYGNTSSPLPFNLEFFTQCHDLHRLVDYLESNPMDFMANSNNIDNNADEGTEFDYKEDPEYIKAQQRTKSSNFYRKYRKLHNELCDVVEDFGLLSFLPLSIQDAESVGRVVARIDKCNGYVFLKNYGDDNAASSNGNERSSNNTNSNNNMQDMFSSAMVADSEWATGILSDVQEKYLGDVMFQENIGELRRRRSRSSKEDDRINE